MTMVLGREDTKPIELKLDDINEQEIQVTDKMNKQLLEYLLPKIESDRAYRMTRLKRYASIDKAKSTWQKLSPEDSIRSTREETTGVQQGIAATLPIIDTHLEDTVAFFTEIYFPSTTIFYSNQGDADKVEQVTKLAQTLETDTKVDGFYATGATVIRSLLKYNLGGMILEWSDGDEDDVGSDALTGNRNEAINVWNFSWDPAIQNVNLIRKEAEWFATFEHKNRLWLLKGAESGDFQRVDKVMKDRNDHYKKFERRFYVHPPTAAGLSHDGLDERTGPGETVVDWIGYGLALGEGYMVGLIGHEIIKIYCWLNPSQVGISDEEKLALYKIWIADSNQIIYIEEQEEAKELPLHIAYFRMDEMGQAQKTYAESMRAFQRQISFMANSAMAVERGNTYNLRVYDPTAIDGNKLQAGQTSGWLASKIAGRDVRSIVANLNQEQDTSRHYAAIGNIVSLMKEMFPSQGLPAQIAGIDRAVNSQVASVMLGAVRRLHMWVKSLDATLFGPWRVACFRNHIKYGAEANNFSSLTEKDVAALLNSGLAQLNREVGAAAIERILFTLIQNPDSAAQFDLVGLFKFWSMLLNNGMDLSQFVAKTGVAGSQGAVTPAEQPVAQENQPPGGAM